MKKSLEEGRNTGRGMRLVLPRTGLRGNTGDRMGAANGSSMEFQDFREYRPGDDIRRLDWAAYARSDKLTVRLYRDEIQPKADLFCDFSASMLCPSEHKAKTALRLAGILAESAMHSGCSLSWWSFGSGWKRLFPYSTSFHPETLPEFGGDSLPDDGFSAVAPFLSHGSVRIVCGDFLWQVEPDSFIRRISDGASRVILCAVLTKEELDPPLSGPATLIDAESQTSHYELIIGKKEREAYLTRLNDHIEMWNTSSFANGATFCLITAGSGLPDISPLVDKGILDFDAN